MEIVKGKITSYDERRGGFVVWVPYTDHERMTKRAYASVMVELPDGRAISPEQRRKIYALIAEISEWNGEPPEYTKMMMKWWFKAYKDDDLRHGLSFSDCDMTTAREFISFLIDFIFEHDIPVRVPLITLCDDIERYVYAALMNKRCAICGKPAELHHVDAIGMGNDRKDIFQIGMRVLPLCREHHSEAHTRGVKWLIDEQRLSPLKLTEEIGRVYSLTRRNIQGDSNAG